MHRLIGCTIVANDLPSWPQRPDSIRVCFMRRRLLTFLMLVILPLQFCYAVAAMYCQHESGQGANHFGHHAHAHQGGDHGSAAKAEQKVKLSVDNDCSGCHLSKPELLAGTISLPEFRPDSASPSGAMATYRSVDPHRIERPNWQKPL